MSDLDAFYGPNAGYVLDLYDRYQTDPASVDPATRAAFEQWTPPGLPPRPNSGEDLTPTLSLERRGSRVATGEVSSPPLQFDVMKVVGAARVTRHGARAGAPDRPY